MIQRHWPRGDHNGLFSDASFKPTISFLHPRQVDEHSYPRISPHKCRRPTSKSSFRSDFLTQGKSAVMLYEAACRSDRHKNPMRQVSLSVLHMQTPRFRGIKSPAVGHRDTKQKGLDWNTVLPDPTHVLFLPVSFLHENRNINVHFPTLLPLGWAPPMHHAVCVPQMKKLTI